MATWPKESCIIHVIDGTTLADKTGDTVTIMEAGDTYPGDAISCTAGSGAAFRFKPDVDLDDEKNYDWYINGAKIGRVQGPGLFVATIGPAT